MPDNIQLIVGLGNPGQQYEATRHNVGAWFVEMLANNFSVNLSLERKFQARVGRFRLGDQEIWLLIPNTYMNQSGIPVQAIAHFYKIPPEAILVAHDELDFEPGTIRLKQDGGHGGHNGLRNIIDHLKNRNFHRLRIGIGHPGDRDQVTGYVLSAPSKKDVNLILDSFQEVLSVLPIFLEGNFQKAILQLHTSSSVS